MISLSGKNLIFLISQPRAGSTLMQLMLAGHPDIATTSEPWIALHPVFALRSKGIDATYNSTLALHALSDFLKQSGVDEGFYKKQVASFLLAFYNKAIEYQNKEKFLDKTPRYYHILNELIDLFPDAKFIILLRNPLAVLSSILKTWVKEDLSFLGEYRDDLMEAPQSMVDFIKLYPNRCLCIKYEEFVVKPDIILKDLCAYLGISYSNEMLEYGGRQKPDWKFGDPIGVKKASNPTIESLDKWKEGFNTPQERFFASSYLDSLGPKLIKEMGYNYSEIKSSVEVPKEEMSSNLISWATIMSDVEGFSKAKKVRETIWQVLSDENVWNKSLEFTSDNQNNIEWFEIIRLAEKRFKDTTLKSLLIERDRLQAERDTLQAEIEAMRNSISWKMTAPARRLKRYFK